MLRKIEKILLISFIYILGFNNAFSMQADIFEFMPSIQGKSDGLGIASMHEFDTTG